jgi:hypothetical protein
MDGQHGPHQKPADDSVKAEHVSYKTPPVNIGKSDDTVMIVIEERLKSRAIVMQ